MNCVSCKSEFIEHRDNAYLCPNCGWMQCLDGKWITISEPAIKKVPVTENETLIRHCEANKTDFEHIENSDQPFVKKYLFGLITTTQKIGIPD